ncbi:hypothetical protein ACHAW5_004479 [Stephanodiscus triporus]|uniref:Uncharacterized protein n=1 Tax=Stephanodiscus triporus TaxID=2934178 RepID=A0ABD3QHK8_9STRA
MSGVSNYRTDKEDSPLGHRTGSFGMEKLLENVREVMNEIHGVKPESFGKGKRGAEGEGGQGDQVLPEGAPERHAGGERPCDIRTIDPTSAYFMSEPQ